MKTFSCVIEIHLNVKLDIFIISLIPSDLSLFLEKFCTIYLRITLGYVCGIFCLHYAKDKNRLAHNLQVHIILKVSVRTTTTKQPDFPTQYIFPSLPFFCTGFLFVFPMRTKFQTSVLQLSGTDIFPVSAILVGRQ